MTTPPKGIRITTRFVRGSYDYANLVSSHRANEHKELYDLERALFTLDRCISEGYIKPFRELNQEL